MIRFLPDTWWDVLMRPLDMISPEANMYVEIAAPDLRLAAALMLALAVLLRGRRAAAERPAVLALLGLTLVAMVPWLATTGNGRYFTAFLLLLGPLCIGLIRLLRLSSSMKFTIAGLLLAAQVFLLVQSTPWGSWTWLQWRDAPYFQLATPPAKPRSYVSLSPISYSLIAPQFPSESRWMNLSAPIVGKREQSYAREWLDKAGPLYLIAPSLPGQTDSAGQPSADVIHVFNRLIGSRGLSIDQGARCELLRSRSLGEMGGKSRDHDKDAEPRVGFWLCPARYEPEAPRSGERPDPADAADEVFEAVERMCPRFFPPGEAETQRIGVGATRQYGNTDTRIYVLNDGEVLYKFWRSINAVTIGRREDVLAGRVHVDCTRIRAPNWRTGGP